MKYKFANYRRGAPGRARTAYAYERMPDGTLRAVKAEFHPPVAPLKPVAREARDLRRAGRTLTEASRAAEEKIVAEWAKIFRTADRIDLPVWYERGVAKFGEALIRIAWARFVSQYLEAATSLLDMLPYVYKQSDQTVVLSPSSAYELVCDIGGNGTELSSLYAGNVCYNGQYLTGGFAPDATSEWVSEITLNEPGFPTGTLHRMFHRTAPATAAPYIQPAVYADAYMPVPVAAPVKPLPYPRAGVARPPAAPPPIRETPPIVEYSAPPPKRTKEIKGQTARALAFGYGVTEAADAVDAVFQALPGKIKWQAGRDGPISYGEKAALIYKYADQIDIGQAYANLVLNQIIDKVVAKGVNAPGKAIKKWARNYRANNKSLGLTTSISLSSL